MVFGIILAVIGVLLLLQNLGFIRGDIWQIVLPCVFIAIGLSIAFKRKHTCCGNDKIEEKMKKFGEKMEETFGDKK
jgi:hypothetical protein